MAARSTERRATFGHSNRSPLYSHYRQGYYVRNDFPWPILGYGTSPGNHKVMYRAFPFYVYQRN